MAEADALWSTEPFPFLEAARLAADIAQHQPPTRATQLAREAQPILRRAVATASDGFRRSMARRLFANLRSELHQSPGTGFGRRRAVPEIGAETVAESGSRALLGLPVVGPVRPAEIIAAYRLAAKAAHPDSGGSPDAFRRIVSARDALLRRC